MDPARIGCTGNSGGGTQTAFMMAIDDRIVAAAPSCYIHRQGYQLRNATGDAEQNVFGQLAFGLDHPDFLMMRAPMPIKVCAATRDFFNIKGTWETFRYAKRAYSILGYSERLDILENNAEHNYNRLQRTAVLRWLARWLLGNDAPLEEPEIVLLSPEEVQCAPEGRVLRMEGARTTYELNDDLAAKYAAARSEKWEREGRAAQLAEVRAIAGVRPLGALPQPKVEPAGEAEQAGCRIEKIILRPEAGVWLPALWMEPTSGGSGRVVLYAAEAGMAAAAAPGGPIEPIIAEGCTVFAVDVRGSGETRQDGQDKFESDLGCDWEDFFKAYVLGRSYVGMRAEDILICARYAAERVGGPVRLVSEGNLGVAALHAAALEPALFEAVRISGCIGSWAEVVAMRPTKNQLINVVHGALRAYDLPDLAAVLGDKLTVERPVDPQGRPLSGGE